MPGHWSLPEPCLACQLLLLCLQMLLPLCRKKNPLSVSFPAPSYGCGCQHRQAEPDTFQNHTLCRHQGIFPQRLFYRHLCLCKLPGTYHSEVSWCEQLFHGSSGTVQFLSDNISPGCFFCKHVSTE